MQICSLSLLKSQVGVLNSRKTERGCECPANLDQFDAVKHALLFLFMCLAQEKKILEFVLLYMKKYLLLSSLLVYLICF